MNVDLLITQFDRIAEAPDAVPRLRRFILDLAVRGRLVKSNYKNVDLRLEGCDIEWVSTVPENWQVNRLGSLITLEYGKAISKEERQGGAVPVYGSNGIIGYSESFLTNKPAIIIGRKGSAGSLNIADGPSWTSDVAYYVIPPPNYDIRFLYLMLSVLDLPNLAKGVKPGLNRNDVYDLVGVLPPLAEQRRIVAKVNELMTVCEELEVQQREREVQRDRVVMAISHKLVHESPADQSLARTVQFYLRNFADLTVRREHVQQWRRTILDLAVRGRLVSQSPDDEPIEDTLVTETDGNFETIEIPFKIPSSWKWIRFGSLHTLVRGVSYSAADVSKEPMDGYIPVLRANNIGERTNYEDLVFVKTERIKPQQLLLRGDYLIALSSGSKNLVGKASYIDRDILASFGAFCGVIRVRNQTFHPYVGVFLSSPFYRETLAKASRGIGINNLTTSVLRELPFPLPPLAEQRRIVAKVNELMTVCDELEQQLSMQEQNAERFMEAVLHGLLTSVVQRI